MTPPRASSLRSAVVALGMFLILLVATNGAAWAQEQELEDVDLHELSLEELLNMEITVTSKTKLTTRETPGIVSVITAAEIRKSGAHDLIDVLRLVPGFDFGVDVQGVVGVGIRGNWAHEGKMLVLVDGQEFNERLYSTSQFGNRFPVDQIKRIEIIRGPGSAVYGGYAELGVINIITKAVDDLEGALVSVQPGRMSNGFGRANVNLSAGRAFDDLEVTAHATVSYAHRSDQVYTDFYGNTFDMRNESHLNTLNVNVGIGYRNLQARLIANQYEVNGRDGFDFVVSEGDIRFRSVHLDLGYDLQINDRLTVTPQLNYKRETPWQSSPQFGEESGLGYEYHILAHRTRAGATATYDPSERLNIVAGVELSQEGASDLADEPDVTFLDQKSVTFLEGAVFGQALARLGKVNLTAGARYQNHEQFGSSFVPRAAVTGVLDRFHFKGLFSRAFRAPGIENINANPDIKPELTTVLELEAGYQLSDNMFVTANAFDITIDRPIIYFFEIVSEDEISEGYRNYDVTGTRGFEVEYRLKDDWGYTNLSYAYYRAKDEQPDSYKVPGRTDLLLGFPAHKATVHASFDLGKGLSVNPSLGYLSERFGYVTADEEETEVLGRFDAEVLANLYVLYENVGVRGLSLGLGVYDLLGSNVPFIQPYNNFHAPLPGPSREIVLKLMYRAPLHR